MEANILQYIVLVSLSLFTSIVTLFTGFGVGTIMMPVAEKRRLLISGAVCPLVAATGTNQLLGSRILPQVSSELFKRIILIAVLLLGILMLLVRI